MCVLFNMCKYVQVCIGVCVLWFVFVFVCVLRSITICVLFTKREVCVVCVCERKEIDR